jgi:hypothetical protein
MHEWHFDVQNLRNDFITSIRPRGFWGWGDQLKKEIVVDWAVGRNFRQVVLHQIAPAFTRSQGTLKSGLRLR